MFSIKWKTEDTYISEVSRQLIWPLILNFWRVHTLPKKKETSAVDAYFMWRCPWGEEDVHLYFNVKILTEQKVRKKFNFA